MPGVIDTILSFVRSSGSLLETEHGLVMLLLLYGLLTYRGEKLTRWVPVVVVVGILLSIFTPTHDIALFWPVITALVVPPFLWQGAVAITNSGRLRNPLNLLVWGGTLALVTFSLVQFGELPFSNALLFGFLALTLVWYLRELDVDRTFLSTLGIIALAVLLAEVDLAVVSVRSWLSSLVSGLAIGFALGFLGVNLYRKIRRPKAKQVFFFAWAYLAYVVGLLMGTSAIATTLAAGLVVATYGYSIGLWYTGKSIPVPSNTPFFFFLAAVLWFTLGWQAHTRVDLSEVWGTLAAMGAITVGVLISRRIAPLAPARPGWRLLRKVVRVMLLLIGAFLFWPREAFLSSLDVEIALGAAILLILLLRYSIPPIFEMAGVQLSWPSESKNSS